MYDLHLFTDFFLITIWDNKNKLLSCLVSDNVAIHHTRDITDTINATGAMVLFVPPYSPDFMPCEEMFV